MKIEILRFPTQSDWDRAKLLALNTVNKKLVNQSSTEWKIQSLQSEHSHIRTLYFTIAMEIPYYVSVHFSRHKLGVEHYVTSQRNDRQDKYDREQAPQSQMVRHIMDVNAQELMFMARKRLCSNADKKTQEVMREIVRQVLINNKEFESVLVPDCKYLGRCREFVCCGLVHKDKAEKTKE